MSRLSSPEDEKAFLTYSGLANPTAPKAALALRSERLESIAARKVSWVDVSFFMLTVL